MLYSYSYCSSLNSLPDISKWDTKNVTAMNYMFSVCCSLNSLPDISKWNTKNYLIFLNGIQKMLLQWIVCFMVVIL